MKSILFITLFNWIVTVRLIFFVKFIRYQRCDLRRPERKLDYLFIQTKKKTILHILITMANTVKIPYRLKSWIISSI